MLERIASFGFSQDPIDISVIYRHLKKLETLGWISFVWDTGSSGPARKVYQLTGDGMDALSPHVEMILDRKKKIEAFLERYQEIIIDGND